ncbi:MAG: sodium/proton-translocating pyrophosphatase, partial [Planctomycetota bacterium]
MAGFLMRWRGVAVAGVVLCLVCITGASALGESSDIVSTGDVVRESPEIPLIWWVAPLGSLLALVFAFIFFRQVKKANPGDEQMQEIAQHVTDGAYAYLKRQYKVVAVFF